MSAKSIYENQGKSLIFRTIKNKNLFQQNSFVVHQNCDNLLSLYDEQTFLNEKIVCKPDQLIKRRGKLGLIQIGSWNDTREWLNEKMNSDFKIGNCTGKLNRFLVEPFIEHETDDEHYLCIYSERQFDVILFYHLGGIEIGNVDEKATRIEIPINIDNLTPDIINTLLIHLDPLKHLVVSEFIQNLYDVYKSQYFTYLEINPLVVKKKIPDDYEIFIMDLAAKIDQTAEFICKNTWLDLEFPAGFGRDAYPEESKIQDLDSKSGASLKLTVINPKGRIWTMVAGGGASVIFADTICDYGEKDELANYGEYSGAPTEQQTYEYAKTILSLMTKYEHKEGKVLLIGGGIANFTNVAATFKGIVKALKEFQVLLKEHNVSIFVRRAGPNYQEGLRIMRELGEFLGVPMHVFGPETHMTSIVAMALHKRDIPETLPHGQVSTANFLLVNKFDTDPKVLNDCAPVEFSSGLFQFNKTTKAIVWGMQNRAIQSMLDFDFVCSRTIPSVSAIVYPMIDDHRQKFYFGHKEILIPVYKKMSKCIGNHPDASVLINFASLRSAYDSTVEVLNDFPQIRCVSIIAEGIPENLTRKIIKLAKEKKVVIIGPATVGGIKPGCFKIGNTGGMMDNIISSKLYRPGSVAYVSKSGGMSNELNNIIALNTDGVYDGVAIGGDRYPGSVFIDFVMKYEHDENVKIIVILGEVGGKDEYDVIKAIKSKMITKPVIAWCIGTCAQYFTTNVQFGHAGSCANAAEETAVVKNSVFREVGAVVPDSFDDLGNKLREVYLKLVASGDIIEKPEVPPPTVPMDYSWARELGIIRKPASFMTSICDERGSELLYAGVPISNIIAEDFGIGGVLGLLWFQRRLPDYCCKFIEMCLMVTADHGPAVSGAHNTIVCARAGKDLISSLTSGLLTIGERFGGALDAAAKQFSSAYDSNQTPMDFVNQTRKDGKLIMGIGHRVKSINNPDQRVEILKKYVFQHFPKTLLLSYALEVEKITTSKKPNLILNVDGFIGVSMVDLLRNSGAFTLEEANEFVEIGSLNALFVLGRSIGFIGHYLDQNRLKQGLYRHPWDDISYVLPEHNDF